MKSFDTNLVVYAYVKDERLRSTASSFLENVSLEPGEWVVSDQVFWELILALSQPLIFRKPLKYNEVIDLVKHLRSDLKALSCCYRLEYFSEVLAILEKQKGKKRLFDIVLAVTLSKNGVKTFYTRNTKDFKELGLFSVVDPFD